MAKTAKVKDLVPEDDAGLESIMDFSDDIADAEAPPALPERDYPAEITKVSVGASKSSGNRMATVVFKIGEDDYPADFDAGNAPGGKNITFYLTCDDSVAGRHRVRNFCEAIDAPMGKQLRVNEWVNRRAKVTVKHDTYEGVVREKISKVQAE